MYERYFITLQKVTNLKWRMNIILPAGKIINRAVGIVHLIFISGTELLHHASSLVSISARLAQAFSKRAVGKIRKA